MDLGDVEERQERSREQRVLAARVRLDWIRGLEERCRRERGRPMTDEELRAGLRRYPGDPLS